MSTAPATVEDENYWANHIKSFKMSPLTCKNYCKEHGIDFNRFSYRYYKVKNKKPAALIPVSVLEQPDRVTELCRVEITGGHSIVVYDAVILDQLLSRLV